MLKLSKVLFLILLISCSSDKVDVDSIKENINNVETIIDSTLIEEAKEDTINEVLIEEERAVYENSTSLEIKKIEEEIEDPISEECMIFLEEYASSISDFVSLNDNISKNPDDINLMIARSSQEDILYSYSSNPITFSCSSNKAFKKQFEILNNKRDKLLSN